MRVMMLTSDLRLGGTEQVMINRVRCLRERRVACAVAGLFEGTGGPGRARERLEREEVAVFCAGIEHLRMAWKMARLREFVNWWRPDVLHCHLFHGHLAGALLHVAETRFPMVWSHHSVTPGISPGRRVFYRLCNRLARAHVFISEAVRRYQFRISGRLLPSEVIYNGMDLSAYLALRPAPGPVFGAVGRLVPRVKGFDVLIRAFARLAREREDVRLRIAGRGPAAEELRRLAYAEGAGRRVEFAGFVENVPEFLSGVNVFVNPSRWEAFGNTLVEAMAAGLPCIATRVGGLPEIGGDCVDWVAPGDDAGLCEAMRRVCRRGLSVEDVRRQRARMARFSERDMTDRYLGVYRLAIGAKA
jgi:glycosyltransferase involved in cell wall biosynthesis